MGEVVYYGDDERWGRGVGSVNSRAVDGSIVSMERAQTDACEKPLGGICTLWFCGSDEPNHHIVHC